MSCSRPTPNVFRHSDPLEGLAENGVFVIQTDLAPESFWQTLPAQARRTIVDRGIRLFVLDAFAIAMSEASDADLRFRMQGAAFMGAFFRTSPLLEKEGATEAASRGTTPRALSISGGGPAFAS